MKPTSSTRSPSLAASWTGLLVLILLLAGLSGELLADYKNAISLYKRQKYREAIKEVQPDVSRNPDWEFGHRLAGLCYFGLKEYPAAIRAFEKAVELKSTEPSVYLGLAESQLQSGKPADALATLEKGKEFFTKQKDLYNRDRLEANIRYRRNDFNGTIDKLLGAFQHFPGTARDWLLLGICYYRTDQVMKARQALTTAQKYDPSLGTAQDYLNRLQLKEGELALKSRNYDIARSTFEAYLQQHPGDGAAKLNLALAMIGQKDWSRAEELLGGLEGQYANSYRYNFYRGYALEKLGKFEAAEGYYRKAIKIENTGDAQEALQRLLPRLKKK